MPLLPFNHLAYARPGFGRPEGRLQNLYVEKTEDGGFTLLPRPGLLASVEVGTGPMRAIYRQEGVFSGDTFYVVGDEVYRGSTLIGTIPGSGQVTIASSATQLVITSGGSAFIYDGTDFVIHPDNDLPQVSAVVYFAGRFVFTELGSDVFYWSEVDDAADIDGLSFATAEGWPDPNLGVFTLGDELVFPGATTFEFWTATGDPDDPFLKTPLRRYMQGCASRRSIVLMDNSFYFVGKGEQGLAVFRAGNVPEAVSTPTIAQALSESSDITGIVAFTVGFDGSVFYVLNIPGRTTFALNVVSQLWDEWPSYGRTTFRGNCALMDNGTAYVGDDETGQVWTLDRFTFADGTDPITRLASAFEKRNGTHHRVMLECARGVGLATGQGSDPLVEMRYSDDGGQTWSPWKQASLGAMGAYTVRATWYDLGQVRGAGRAMEFRCTDPVLTTFNYLISSFRGDPRF